jgi:hypothetical protein
MATISKVQLPDDLMHSIERRAASSNIPIEEQVVRDLLLADREQVKPDENAVLAEIRRDREAMAAKGVFLTDDFLKKAKSWGRP